MLSTFCRYIAMRSMPYVSSAVTGMRSMPPACWKYVNCEISSPSSHTCQPSPHAPSVGDSQSSSTKRTSWSSGLVPIARSDSR